MAAGWTDLLRAEADGAQQWASDETF